MKEITSKEAAFLLGVQPSRIRQFILANRVRSRKVGNTRLIVLDDVEKLLGERKNGRPYKDKAA